MDDHIDDFRTNRAHDDQLQEFGDLQAVHLLPSRGHDRRDASTAQLWRYAAEIAHD